MNDLEHHPLFAEKPVGKQGEFYRSLADSRWCIAGNRAGKTRCLLREVAWWATGLHPYRTVTVPTHGWVITLDRDFAESTLLPILLEFLPSDMVSGVKRGDVIRVTMKDGGTITFRTYGQGWMKFQGAKIAYAAFDEECPEDVYDEVMVRLIDLKGPHWVAMTPLQGKTWVWTRIVKPRATHDPKDVEIFQWKTTDNSAIDGDRARKVFASMDSNIRIARMSGQFVDMQGLIWKEFDERAHMVDEYSIPPHWKLWCGMDGGTRHPFAAVMGATDERGGIVIWKVYERSDGLASQHAKAILEIFKEYVPWAVDGDWETVFTKAMRGESAHIDRERPTIRARFTIDPSAQQMRMEFYPYGIFATNADRDLLGGIGRVGELFLASKEGGPGLTLMKGRANPLLDELRLYSWARKGRHGDGPQKPQNEDDDCCDALRYLAMEHPTASETLKQETPEHTFPWYLEQKRKAKHLAGLRGMDESAMTIESRLIRLGRAF